MQVKANRSQDLANLIVQFACNVLAFGFLCFEQAARICLQNFLRPSALCDVPRRTLNTDCHSIFIDHATTYFYRPGLTVLANDLSFVRRFDRSV